MSGTDSLPTWLVTLKDGRHEVCLEVEAADEGDAKIVALLWHPNGKALKVQAQ